VIDLRRLGEDPDYRAGAVAKGIQSATIDDLLAAEAHRRDLQQQTETARALLNAASKEIARADPADRDQKVAEAQKLKADLAVLESRLQEAAAPVDEVALAMPNPAEPGVPVGGEEDYRVVDEVGGRPPPPPLDHAEFGERLGFVQSDRAVDISGSRFAYLMGPAVQLQFALVQRALARLVDSGFVPVVPPVLVREQMMVDAGFFPTDRHQVYEIAGDDLFLAGTAEIPLAGLHRGEHLDIASLPRRYVGYSTCFRREAGTYGTDTRGIFRVHQFDKVEMFSFAEPDRSGDELEALRALQEELVAGLGLPYRVIETATGDLGAAAARKYDIEVWLPSEGRYRELTSASNYTDFSARRMGTRFRGPEGSGVLHTLNGTACAVSRTLVFLFEHCQQPDGSFVVPEALRPWCGFSAVDVEGRPVA